VKNTTKKLKHIIGTTDMADLQADLEKLKYGNAREKAMKDYFNARPGIYKNPDTIQIFMDGFEHGFNLRASQDVKPER
jgi:hypothetical protein